MPIRRPTRPLAPTPSPCLCPLATPPQLLLERPTHRHPTNPSINTSNSTMTIPISSNTTNLHTLVPLRPPFPLPARQRPAAAAAAAATPTPTAAFTDSAAPAASAALEPASRHPSATTTAPLVPAPPPPSDIPSGLPLPPAYREKVQQLKAILLDRKNWKVCRGTPTSSHKVPPGEFDAGELVCRNCKQHDPKFFLEPEQADAKIKELLSSEPCHFVPRYDQAGCGVDRDRPNYDSKDWTTWALKPNSRGTVLRERLWQCCLGGGRKAAAKYRAGQAKNTTKIGCPRSLYAVTRWDAQEQCAKLVEIYFKHKHLPECYEHASTSKGGVAGGDE
ncbi:hypothetical protein BCR44DRAFT_1034647 [Catenaria anguillulae PL171]|uniref:Uncharacterized protein n=1 Tax=Catenaria anguillulae PL171 TaxID=765915 RepID=A0A1Y2HWK2_9FUNG|nr:hypothetical protein BCR44DRAFT_1034647 [Catenaria anguillulae PL171]